MINGHKWFISNAHRANFAILIARTEDDPDLPQAANTAFIVDLPADGWTEVREIETMHGSTGHSEIRIEDLRVHDRQMLGGRGQGHLLGQYRLGPARLAHCMRWIAQAETALDMMVDRSLNRFSHGSLLAEKQGIQWLIADSTMELYQAKLMVLHAAYKVDAAQRDVAVDFKSEVSMAKHFVANMLNRVRSTGRSRCTAPSATPPTRRSPTCTSTPAGPAWPTAPTRSTRCASPSARSPPTRTTAPPRPPPDPSPSDRTRASCYRVAGSTPGPAAAGPESGAGSTSTVKVAVVALPAVTCSGRGDRAAPNPAAGLEVLIASLACARDRGDTDRQHAPGAMVAFYVDLPGDDIGSRHLGPRGDRPARSRRSHHHVGRDVDHRRRGVTHLDPQVSATPILEGTTAAHSGRHADRVEIPGLRVAGGGTWVAVAVGAALGYREVDVGAIGAGCLSHDEHARVPEWMKLCVAVHVETHEEPRDVPCAVGGGAVGGEWAVAISGRRDEAIRDVAHDLGRGIDIVDHVGADPPPEPQSEGPPVTDVHPGVDPAEAPARNAAGWCRGR